MGIGHSEQGMGTPSKEFKCWIRKRGISERNTDGALQQERGTRRMRGSVANIRRKSGEHADVATCPICVPKVLN
jgi:hypothetical protein